MFIHQYLLKSIALQVNKEVVESQCTKAFSETIKSDNNNFHKNS